MPLAKNELIDRSGVITENGVSQLLAPENEERVYLLVQNINGRWPLWVDFGKEAEAGGTAIRVDPGDSLVFAAGMTGVVPAQAVHVMGEDTSTSATEALRFVAKEG